MRLQHALPRRLLPVVVPFLAVLAVAMLGGCSVAGGVTGSVGQAGGRIGVSVDIAILDAARWHRTEQQYDVKTVYVVPDYKASP